MKKRSVLFLFCVTLFLTNSSIAQDTIPNTSVEDLFTLSLDDFLEVVITPSKLARSVDDVTQKVDVIQSNDIDQVVSGNRNICEIISKLPGVSVSVLSRNDANWGTYGGIGPKYSTYMVQGLPVDAFIEPMSIDLNAIDRIEVQRGPASVMYPNYMSQDFAGNQSPLAGTVNMILKDRFDRSKTSFQTSVGSYNTLNSKFYHQNISNNVHYYAGATYEMSDYTNYGIDGSWLNMQKNPEYSKTKIYGGMTLFFGKEEKQKLTVYSQGTFHKGDAGRVYKGFHNQYGIVNVGYDAKLSDRLSLQSHLGIRSYDRAWQESTFGVVDTLNSDNGVKQLIVPVDISLTIAHGRSNALVMGLDYQSARYSTWTDPVNGIFLFGNISDAMQGGLYLQEEWRPVSGLTLRGGLRYSYIRNTIALENFGKPLSEKLSWDKILWSAGLRYKLHEKVSVYLNSGTSFSTPALKSIGGTIPMSDLGVPGRNGQLPNPDLKPESGIGTDLGFDFTLPSHIKIGVRAFYTILKDGIVDNVVSQNPSQSQSINTESVAGGGELEISQKVNSIISWYANATHMLSSIQNEINADQHQTEIPFSPQFVLNGGGIVQFPFGLTITPAVNYNGGYFDGISKSGRTKYVPGWVFNTYISQQFIRDGFDLECFARLYNLTNNDYHLPWQFKNPGFSAMLGLKITF